MNIQEVSPQLHSRIKELLISILQLTNEEAAAIKNDTPFFDTDEQPGIIQDSLAILELATVLSEEYGILPSDLDQQAFVNIDMLAQAIEKHKNVS